MLTRMKSRPASRNVTDGFVYAWVIIMVTLWFVPQVPADLIATAATLSHVYFARALLLTRRAPSEEHQGGPGQAR